MDATVVSHRIAVQAPARTVYRIVADVSLWPLYFEPTVHAEQLSRSGDTELIRIWALANGELRTWVSRRRLDDAGLTITFEQTEPPDPVAQLGGEWRVTEAADGTCTVVLDHTYRAVDDDPLNLDRIARAVDANSISELDCLKRAAENDAAELLLDFEDTEVIRAGGPEAYGFINDLSQWPARIPHVLRMVVTEDVPGLQIMEMDTKATDGSVHTTVSGRVCFPYGRIVYKQTKVAGVLRAHIGRWHFDAVDGGVQVTAGHTVILDADAIGRLPNPPASLAEARTAVRNALGANSQATMATAKDFLEHTDEHTDERTHR